MLSILGTTRSNGEKGNTGHILPRSLLSHKPLRLLCMGTSMSKRPRAQHLPTLPLRHKLRGAGTQQLLAVQVIHNQLHRKRALLCLLLQPLPPTRRFVPFDESGDYRLQWVSTPPIASLSPHLHFF
jgi:hypothetical protein